MSCTLLCSLRIVNIVILKGKLVGRCYYAHFTEKKTEAQHGSYSKQGFMVVILELRVGATRVWYCGSRPMTLRLFSAASQLLDGILLCRFLVSMGLCGCFDILC